MREVGRFAAGEVFAERYVVDRLLKAGGMGAVYVVRHVRTDEQLALKVMRPELVAMPGQAARFEQEARVGAMIQSAGVVKVIDAGVDPATEMPFLVMELLRGRELGELIAAEGRIGPERVVRYLTQTARTLDKAHAAGVIHRDLKPDNLFVVEGSDEEIERVKILDFGIAKLLLAVNEATTQAQGTPLYMAPEQTRRGEIGSAADIWPLGLIGYAMLVGCPYWDADTVAQLYGEILSANYESPTTRAAKSGVVLPTGFDAWFFRCVAFDPSKRFARATDAARVLAEVLGQPIPASSAPDPGLAATVPSMLPPPLAATTNAAVSQTLAASPANKRAAWIGAIALVVIGAGAVYARRERTKVTPPAHVTVTHPTNPIPGPIANPIIVSDHPDPSVLRVVEGGIPTYYLVATVGNTGDIPVWKSTDLFHWEQLPNKLLRRASNPGSSLSLHGREYCSIWAPELTAMPSGFMLHFTAQRFASPQSPCPPYREDSSVYLASSNAPTGPFATDDKPWEPLPAGAHIDKCPHRDKLPRSQDLASPNGDAIRLDSHVFTDEGRWWLAYSWFGTPGGSEAGQHVRVVELDPSDPYVVRCDPAVKQLTLLNANDFGTLEKLRTSCARCSEMLSFTKGQQGEEMMRMGASYGIVEGASLFRRKGLVYALVSHSGWNSAYYSVMWMAAPTVEGLAEPSRRVGRFLVPSKGQSFGHGSPVLAPDGEHFYYVHHHLDHLACQANNHCTRDVWITPMEFESDGAIKPTFPAER